VPAEFLRVYYYYYSDPANPGAGWNRLYAMLKLSYKKSGALLVHTE